MTQDRSNTTTPGNRSASVASLMVIFFTVFIDLIGFGIIIPVLQPYARHFGASDLEAGLLMGVFSAVQFFVIPVWGWLSDRYGRKPVILTGLAGSCVSYLVLANAPDLTTLFVGRIMAGISAGNLVAAQAYIADITTPENRAKGMGLIGAAFGLGFILGPMIGGILSVYSFSHPSYAAAIASGLALVFGLAMLKESLPPERRPRHAPMRHPILNLSHFIHDRPVFLVITVEFFFTIAFAMWETVFVLFLANKVYVGLEEKLLSHKVGYLYAFAGLLSALIQGGGIHHLVKKLGEKVVAQVGLVILVVASLGFAGLEWWQGIRGQEVLFPLLALIGLGSGLANPTLSAMVSKLVSPQRQGEVLGAYRGVGSLARFVGPFGGSFLFAWVGHASPFLLGVALLILSAVLLGGEFRYWEEASTE
jgi:MFS transporter, DHA1 family, tetracycline resistance protein